MRQSDADSQAGLAGLSPKTCLIGLDWGTSSLRAYRMGAKGRVLEQREASSGIMQLQSAGDDRSEERRVGKEGRWRGGTERGERTEKEEVVDGRRRCERE